MKAGVVLILFALALAACATSTTRTTSSTGMWIGGRALCVEDGTGLVYLRERCDK